ncbi:V-type proton ATPase subunit a [Daphnia magna]|uniref:V-type proton ATPase subunit a n=1 Tax=Daphnia magna TaxID=35525 RepID=A0A162CDI3_9CRUS|nr:V-type proton ATPase subunit a [Daphnia magna]
MQQFTLFKSTQKKNVNLIEKRHDENVDFQEREDQLVPALFAEYESAYRCMSELGELGCVEFRDLNSEATAFQRTFSAEVTRCNEMERKLRYLEGQIVKEDIKIEELLDMPAAPLPKEMVDLEAALDKMESELREINVNAEEASDSAFPPILNELPTNAKPPTYFRTNKFTHGFQALVNAYGIANYREVNPGLYTIITFPFLFAVMFGDGGHALIVTMFASWMCLNEEKLSKVKGEVFGIIFGGRYIILLMGIFSIYTGFIYHVFFAKAFNIFGSAWVVNYRSEGRPGEEYLIGEGSMESAMLVPDRHYDVCPNRTTSKAYNFDNATDFQSCGHYRQYPYPFGVDPVWVIAENKIVFLNSYKMKLSIILGVFHMSFGVFLNLWNFTYFKRRVSILLEFLPRILFFWPLFGYMMSLMFLKWVKYGANKEERELKSDCAPSILITFINMMLLSYSEEKTRPPNEECKTVFMFGDDEGVTQKTLQIAFVLIAVLSVPVLLFGTPIQFKMKMNRMNKAKNNYSHSGSLGSSGHGDPADREPIVNSTLHVESGGKHDVHDGHSGDYDQNQGSNDDEHNTFGDVMIYQAIHTIEYVLECISHTASYLRLWALSLAHSQLSEVLWFMVLRIGFKALPGYLGSISIFLTFAFWAGATVSILIAMEGMSAFLHTLRLHWVEFQSKFYKGEGVKFHAFHFKRVTDDAKDD